MKKILPLFFILISACLSYAQEVNVNYLNPTFGSDTPYRFLRFGNSTRYWGGWMWNNNDIHYGNGNDMALFTYGDRDIVFQPGAGNVVFFPKSGMGGNVGIGTTSPQAKLHVNGSQQSILVGDPNSTTHPALRFLGGYTNGYTYIQAGGVASPKIRFTKYSSEAGNLEDFQVYSTKSFFSGDVGIGTTSPNSWFGGKVFEMVGDRPVLKLNSGSLSTIVLTNNQVNASTHTGEFHINHQFNPTNQEKSLLRFSSYPAGDIFTIQSNGLVGIGTTTPDSKLTVAGKIHAQEVKVTITAGADFVFADDYALPDLKAVEAYVKENKHLPEIASAAEMEANGLYLAEMNIKLLQKVEELTLYTIQQEKELEEQRKANEEQQALIQQLFSRLELLEQK